MMRKKRGIVCEKKKHYAILLTDKGEFLRGIPMGEKSDIGDEVEFRQVHGFDKRRPMLFGSLAMAAVLLFFLVSSLIPNTDKAMAYVQVETDVAMELAVNKNGKVISLRQLNETSSGMESRFTKLNGQPVRVVLYSTIQELSQGKGQVIITTIFSNGNSDVQGIVASAVSGVQKEHNELTWKINESTAEDRVMANKQQMSVHTYKESKKPGSLRRDNGFSPTVEEQTSNSVKEQEKSPNSVLQPEEQGKKSNPVIYPNEQGGKNKFGKQHKEKAVPGQLKKQPVPPGQSGGKQAGKEHPGNSETKTPKEEKMKPKEERSNRSNRSSDQSTAPPAAHKNANEAKPTPGAKGRESNPSLEYKP